MAAEVHESARTARVELILREIESLPTLSPVVMRLLEATGRDDSGLGEISGIIESDPSLTARILGLCARADKGLSDRITTVRKAVVMLGLEAVQAAALSVSVFDVLDSARSRNDLDAPEAGREVRFDRTGFWEHALGVACASEMIASAHPKSGVQPGDAFVAGLLHDLGKLALDLVLPRSYGRVLAVAQERRAGAAGVERAVMSLDHHAAGRRLGQHWSLPEPLWGVMWLHGQAPEALPDVPYRELIGIVTAAKALCRELHIGWSGEFDVPRPVEGVCAAFGLDGAAARQAAPRLHEAVAARARSLGLHEATTPDLIVRSLAGANRALGRVGTALERKAREANLAAEVAIERQRKADRLAEQLADAARDIAEAQNRLAEAQSMARLGQFAAGAAHEMNNPLAVISGRSQMLAARLAEGPDAADARAVAEAAGRLSELITSLHLLAEAPRPVLMDTDPAALAAEAISSAEERVKVPGRVEVTSAVSAPASLDRQMVRTILIELVANALEASIDGLVKVRIESASADNRLHGDCLRFTVEDQGPGMSSMTLQHAFDPFFSDKPAGRRTGLGLTRARRLAEALDGMITLHSEPGRGTSATLELPLRPARTIGGAQ
jgi:signal transduction histidine kinase